MAKRNGADVDTRVVYGARCFWWGDIQDVGLLKMPGESAIRGDLPCCPHCRSPLFEVDDEATFLAGAEKYEADGHPGYVEFIKWSKGRCFPSLVAAQQAYERRPV
jgi:alkyl hydroperoxide reductase subunit AhpF